MVSVSRLYVPATLELLAEWHELGVIDRLDDGFEPSDDSEESEYAALMSAADASTSLGGRDRRRIVVVVDTKSSDAASTADVVAVHADDKPRTEDADPDDDLSWYATQEIPDLFSPA